MLRDEIDRARFVALLAALGDDLSRVVIVGGWAHRLFALHPLARRSASALITTLDVDVAVPTGANPSGLDRRLREAAFRVELVGREAPVTKYYPPDGADEFHVEFLAPRHGSESVRGGTARKTIEIGGVVACLLPHLEMLVEDAWRVTVSEERGFPVGRARYEVAIPNPARYMAHKLMVLEQRHAKRPNDVRYVHDTIQLFGDALPELAKLASQIRWTKEGRRRFRAGRRLLQSVDLVARAARIPDANGAVADAQAMRMALDRGLDALFADTAAPR